MENGESGWENYPRTGKEAREKGVKHYFTGEPCKHGHLSYRLASTRTCIECQRVHTNQWRGNNPEKYLESSKKQHYKNREKRNRDRKENRKKNEEREKEYQKKYRKENATEVRRSMKIWRDNNKEYMKEWRENNKDRLNAHFARYRAKKKGATPTWADMKEINYVYSLAKEKGQVVDHIVPLTSELVCGLHCGDNLRVIPHSLNSYKGNRYWPDMPS